MKNYIVRWGHRVSPTCPKCGCRLHLQESLWIHFQSKDHKDMRDARGCVCEYTYMGLMYAEKNPVLHFTGPLLQNSPN